MRALPLLVALLLVGCDALGGGGVEIVPYVGDPITEADATVRDDRGEPVAWLYSRTGDVVSIYRSYLCGDECTVTLTLRFEGTGDLPTDVAGTLVVRELLPERTEYRVLDIARVEVQDWAPGAYSGVVHVEPREGVLELVAPIVFWADDDPSSVD